MKEKNKVNIILWFIISLLVISLLFTFNLLLVEYIRIFILGVIVSVIYVIYSKTFYENQLRIYLIIGAYIYILWLLDPALNGNAFFGNKVQALNFYRITTFLILLIAMINPIFKIIKSDLTFKDYWNNFTKTDRYIIIGIIAFGVLFALLETLHARVNGGSVSDAILRGSKFIDCIFLFILISQIVTSQNKSIKKEINILVFAFLIFAMFTTLIGAGKATRAYYTVRLPEKQLNRKRLRYKAYKIIRENLLKVFSINSKEAIAIYEAGYYAGEKKWEQSLKKLKKADKYPKFTIDEEKLIALINLGEYDKAIQIIENFPLNYRFRLFDIEKEVNKYIEKIKNNKSSSKYYYLAGLLYKHIGDKAKARKFFSAFVAVESNDVNALYFLYNGEEKKLEEHKIFSIPAVSRLSPRISKKSVEKSGNILTIVNNQQVEGKIWLLPGQYKVTIYAKDSGTPYNIAKKKSFDPTCKLRVWVDNTFENLHVLSTNNQFKAYAFIADIKNTPTDIIIEFVNDTYDQKKKLDRNVSLSKITFEKLKENEKKSN